MPNRSGSRGNLVSHAVEVCRVLCDLPETRMDTTLACAALLHDGPRTPDITLADVEKHFGKEVASLEADQAVGDALRQP